MINTIRLIDNKSDFIYKLFPVTIISGGLIQMILQVLAFEYFNENIRSLTIGYIGIFCIIDVLIG